MEKLEVPIMKFLLKIKVLVEALSMRVWRGGKKQKKEKGKKNVSSAQLQNFLFGTSFFGFFESSRNFFLDLSFLSVPLSSRNLFRKLSFLSVRLWGGLEDAYL